jgi:arylsulfatase A-like enzyme
MLQKLEASTSQVFRGVFGSALKEWLFIFLTVLVPLDFLYRLGALLNDLPPFQLVRCFSSAVIFFTILSLFLSLLLLVAARVCAKISLNGAELVNKVNTIIGILFVAIIFTDYLWPWMQIIFSGTDLLLLVKKIRYLLIVLFFIIFIAISILISKRFNHILQQVRDIFERFFKINIIIVMLSIIFLLFYAGASYFTIQKQNVTTPLADKNKLNFTPNIILITFDALAAQHMSLYGYHLKTTPNLDKLGQESYIFDNMYGSCNWTLPSLSSLLSGKHPTHHQLKNMLSYFYGINKNQNLPVVLKALGYETAVAWSNGLSCPWRSNLAGIDKVSPNLSLYRVIYVLGFGANPWLYDLITTNHIYKFIFEYPQKFMKKPDEPEEIIRPGITFAHATKLLDSMQKPFFIWMHIYPPHSPYLPGDGFMYSILKEKVLDTEEKFLRLSIVNPYPTTSQPIIDKLAMRYDETICSADYELGKFLSFLKEKGLFNNSIVIFSADHGEMFERGFLGHGGPYLYQSLAHIPLVVHLPGQTQGQRIGADVSHIDVAPTILDLLGVTPPKWMDGRSFLPALKDHNFDTGTKFSMNLSYINLNTNIKLQTKVVAAIKGNYKLINYLDWNRYELYDFKNDPREKTNLITDQPVIFSSLKGQIDQLLGR